MSTVVDKVIGRRRPNAQDLLKRLGNIPPGRVVLDPPPGRATEADLIRMLDGEPKELCELVEDTLVRKDLDDDWAPKNSLADLLKRLGGIPPERVLLDPPPGMATEEDAIELMDGEPKQLCELVEGTLVEKPMGHNESRMSTDLLYHLKHYLRSHDIGYLTGESGSFRLKSTMRMPDVAFVSWRHFPNKKKDVAKYPVLPFPPDLAVEVLSKTNTKKEIEQKRLEYFEFGVKLVWVVDPKKQTIGVYRQDGTSTVLVAEDVLSGEDVLPGLEVPVSELF
jgi:Uma2 family endonuclease